MQTILPAGRYARTGWRKGDVTWCYRKRSSLIISKHHNNHATKNKRIASNVLHPFSVNYVTNYVFLRSKTFVLKIRWCKIFYKYYVWQKELETFSVLARFPDPLVFESNWVGEPCYLCLCLNDSDTVSKIASSCRQRNQLWCRPGCTLCNAQISCDSTSDWADTNSEIMIIHPFPFIQRVPHKSHHMENSICVDLLHCIAFVERPRSDLSYS